MLRLLLLLILLFSLKADSAAEKLYRVYFLGDSEPPARRAHDLLLQAIKNSQPELLKKIRLVYIDTSSRHASLNSALLQAAAENPDLVLALSGRYAVAARKVFTSTPLIFSSFEDPVQHGIVSDMRSRQEPVCGISLADSLEGKRFEILRQAFPSTRQVAILANRHWAENMGGRVRAEQEAARQGFSISLLLAEDASQVRSVFRNSSAAHHDAWYIPATPLTDHAASLIIQQMQEWKKPSIWTSQMEVRQGAPMAYSQETGFVWRSVAELIARVHAGEPPGSIPILRPMHFTLTVRVDPGSAIPPPDISVVRRADHVVR